MNIPRTIQQRRIKLIGFETVDIFCSTIEIKLSLKFPNLFYFENAHMHYTFHNDK